MSNIALEMAPYFRRVEDRLKCPKKRRHSLLNRIHRAAEEFAAENPEATADETAEYLGDPAEVAQELMETLDPEELECYQRQKKIGTWLVIGLLIVALVAAGIWIVRLEHDTSPVEVIDTLVIYEEVKIP